MQGNQQRRRSSHKESIKDDLVNERDVFGNTPLMVAVVEIASNCVSSDSLTIPDYESKRASILALAESRKLNINLQDLESGYTVLHKCIYHGNLDIFLKILQLRPDANLGIKDKEGCTCLDLLNITMKQPRLFADLDSPSGYLHQINKESQTGPYLHHNGSTATYAVEDTTSHDSDGVDTFLDDQSFPNSSTLLNPATSVWSWGSNKNFTLGFPNTQDRAIPEQIDLVHSLHTTGNVPVSYATLSEYDSQVEQVVMSKYHVCIRTKDRLYTHGFGGGGRLGLGHEETTMRPTEVTELTNNIGFVAAGPDHTIAITLNGDVWTWGSNKYAQLGYYSEASGDSLPRECHPQMVQLKKTVCVGGAGSKYHSVVYTTSGVIYTWGTNNGQLGYQQPVQVVPRKVTSFPVQMILSVASTNCSTAVLVGSFDVYVFAENKISKVVFPFSKPLKSFTRPQSSNASLLMSGSRPSQPAKHGSGSSHTGSRSVVKIVSGNHQYAALMSTGDVYMWSPPESRFQDSWQQVNFPQQRPKLVWSVRKKFMAAHDVDIGVDSSIIIGTVSGHVFVGTRRVQAQSTQPLASSERSVYVSPAVAAAKMLNESSVPGASSSGIASTLSLASYFSQGGLSSMHPKDSNVFFKYTMIPNLQHIVMVVASSGGAFAAVRSDCRPSLPPLPDNQLSSDLYRALYPLPLHLEQFQQQLTIDHYKSLETPSSDQSANFPVDAAISHIEAPLFPVFEPPEIFPNSSFDIEFEFEGCVKLYAHRAILAARSPVFWSALSSINCADSPTEYIAKSPKKSKSPETRHIGYASSLKSLLDTMTFPEKDVPLVRFRFPHIHSASGKSFLYFVYTGCIYTEFLLSDSVFASENDFNDQSFGSTDKQNNHRNSNLFNRAQIEFTKLARCFELDETEILYANIKAGLNPVSPTLAPITLLPRAKSDHICYTNERFQKSISALYHRHRDRFTDVVIHLADDHRIEAHSVILSARSTFFNAIVGPGSLWNCHAETDSCAPLLKKQNIDLTHISHAVFLVVIEWIYTNADASTLFESLNHSNPAEFIEFVTSVMAAADELLLSDSTYLKDCCSDILVHLLDIKTAVSFLKIADRYSSARLKNICLDFICWNLETFLECSRWFRDLDEFMIFGIESRLRVLQTQKSPCMRGPDGFYAQLRARTIKAQEVSNEKKQAVYEIRKQAGLNHNTINESATSVGTTDLPFIYASSNVDYGLLKENVISSSSFGSRCAIGSQSTINSGFSASSTYGSASCPGSSLKPVCRFSKTQNASITSPLLSAVSPSLSAISPGESGTVGDHLDEQVFQLELDTDLPDQQETVSKNRANDKLPLVATSRHRKHGTSSQADPNISTYSSVKSKKSTFVKLDVFEASSDSSKTTGAFPAGSSLPETTPVLKGWSPVMQPVNTGPKMSLREIMDETRKSETGSGSGPSLSIPSPVKLGPSVSFLIPPSPSSLKPIARSIENAPHSPFNLGEPMEPLKLVKSKPSQKQRKKEAAKLAAQTNIVELLPSSSPAWKTIPICADVLTNSLSDTRDLDVESINYATSSSLGSVTPWPNTGKSVPTKFSTSASSVVFTPVVKSTRKHSGSIAKTQQGPTTDSCNQPRQQQQKPLWPVQSFADIQNEQVVEAQTLARTLQKSLLRIQMEEEAVRALTEYYTMTQANGTGEWFHIRRGL
ncbi:hypothetical protein QVD99_003207 [Batrachochytrium dendrobatidis]|nr:hypothetical protein O5D80_001630 [Batrachochytrium dendrobatidis]KAK5670527.1 hypothetical protein QVD99_003207 [Batrachochytrium dendrobatidis]